MGLFDVFTKSEKKEVVETKVYNNERFLKQAFEVSGLESECTFEEFLDSMLKDEVEISYTAIVGCLAQNPELLFLNNRDSLMFENSKINMELAMNVFRKNYRMLKEYNELISAVDLQKYMMLTQEEKNRYLSMCYSAHNDDVSSNMIDTDNSVSDTYDTGNDDLNNRMSSTRRY